MDINEYDLKLMDKIKTHEMARAVSYAINGMTEEQVLRDGHSLRKIIIRCESGFGLADFAYRERLVITETYISYQYSPKYKQLSKIKTYKWAYRTDSESYKNAFHKLVEYFDELAGSEDIVVLDGDDVTVEFIYYGDIKAKFTLAPDLNAKTFIRAIKRLIPPVEQIPKCLR